MIDTVDTAWKHVQQGGKVRILSIPLNIEETEDNARALGLRIVGEPEIIAWRTLAGDLHGTPVPVKDLPGARVVTWRTRAGDLTGKVLSEEETGETPLPLIRKGVLK